MSYLAQSTIEKVAGAKSDAAKVRATPRFSEERFNHAYPEGVGKSVPEQKWKAAFGRAKANMEGKEFSAAKATDAVKDMKLWNIAAKKRHEVTSAKTPAWKQTKNTSK